MRQSVAWARGLGIPWTLVGDFNSTSHEEGPGQMCASGCCCLDKPLRLPAYRRIDFGLASLAVVAVCRLDSASRHHRQTCYELSVERHDPLGWTRPRFAEVGV